MTEIFVSWVWTEIKELLPSSFYTISCSVWPLHEYLTILIMNTLLSSCNLLWLDLILLVTSGACFILQSCWKGTNCLRYCQTPVLGIGLGVDFTFANNNNNYTTNNNNSPHLIFLRKTTVIETFAHATFVLVTIVLIQNNFQTQHFFDRNCFRSIIFKPKYFGPKSYWT